MAQFRVDDDERGDSLQVEAGNRSEALVVAVKDHGRDLLRLNAVEILPCPDGFPVRRDKCVHRRIHASRYDGRTSLCLDCGDVVRITPMYYATGETEEEQTKRIWRELELLKGKA